MTDAPRSPTRAIATLNDGTDAPPRLRADINLGTLWDLPPDTAGPIGEPRLIHEAIRDAGYEGVQGGDPALCAELGLACTTFGVVRNRGEIEGLVKLWVDLGMSCSTLHVGTGLESQDHAYALIDEVIDASVSSGLPLYIETHRATLTQDIWRTVQLVERFPELRFNGDFSHWYTGLEMTYGDFDEKLAFLTPVFERTVFMHGRIGDPGAIQVPLVPFGSDHVASLLSIDHFRQFWTATARGFLTHAQPGDVLVFAPELLPSFINYARTVPATDPASDRPRVEESDRWVDALAMTEIAKECFAAAQP